MSHEPSNELKMSDQRKRELEEIRPLELKEKPNLKNQETEKFKFAIEAIEKPKKSKN